MTVAFARKLLGSSNERRIKGYLPRVAEITALEGEFEKLTDDEAFKKQIRTEPAATISCPDPWLPALLSAGPIGHIW
jgi:preprotein translocase subunit SecA